MTNPADKRPSIMIDMGQTIEPVSSNSMTGLPIESVVKIHESGDLDRAEREYRKILNGNPKDSNAMHLIGVIAMQQKKHADAESWITKALSIEPNQGIFLNSLGRVYRETERNEQAMKCLLEARSQRPNDPSVLLNIGLLFQQTNNHGHAVEAYKRVLEINEKDEEARTKLIFVLTKLKRFQDALEAAQFNIENKPESSTAWATNGYLNLQMDRFEEAISDYEKSIAIDSSSAVDLSNLGVSYQAVCRFEDAVECYEKALVINPKLPEALNNLGIAALIFGDQDKAKHYFERSAAISEDYYEPRYCLGEIELSKGNYKEGWEGYELRFLKPKHDHRNFDHEKWEGQSLGGKRLLVHTEQGVGDVFMFASCIPDLLKQEKNCLIEADSRLAPILKRSFPEVDCVIRPPEVAATVQIKYPDVDFQVGMGSLPVIFRHSKDDFPRTSYLKADPNLRSKWADRLAELGEGMKIGISWRGGNSSQVAFKRCSEFAEWKSLLSVPNTHIVNLQYGNCENEIALAKDEMGVTLNAWDDLDLFFDLENMFALMSELDLVISIDNATVHFAGAMGVPCWMMLHKLPEWRWGLESDECDWYSSLKLFRQQKALDWKPVFERMETELKATSKQFLVEGQSAILPKRDVLESSTPNNKSTISISMKPKCGAVVAVLGEQAGTTQEAQMESMQRAWAPETAAFSSVFPLTMKDPSEASFACHAFNFGIRRAEEQGCDWVFLLEDGDMVAPNAFSVVAPYLENYDAIWGEIYYLRKDGEYADRLEGQVGPTNDVNQILNTSPEFAFHSGHFIRTEIAKAYPFHEKNLIGSHVGNFLHLWTQHRCIKIDQPLVVGKHPEHRLSEPEIVAFREMRNLLWQKGREDVRAA